MRFAITLSLILFLALTSRAQEEYDSTQALEEAIDQYDSTQALADQESYEQTPVVNPANISSTQDYRSKKLNVRKVDRDAWKKIVGETNFDEKPPKEEEPVQKPRTRLSPWGGGVLKILSYVFIIALVIFMLYYFIRNSSSGANKVKDVVRAVDLAAQEEDLDKFDMESLLQQARDSSNLPLVIRIYYLGLLKKLNEAAIIAWKKDKTNFDYLMELFSKNYHYEEIKRLTIAYEVIWYGERRIRQEPYDQLIRDFENMHDQVKAGDPL